MLTACCNEIEPSSALDACGRTRAPTTGGNFHCQAWRSIELGSETNITAIRCSAHVTKGYRGIVENEHESAEEPGKACVAGRRDLDRAGGHRLWGGGSAVGGGVPGGSLVEEGPAAEIVDGAKETR